MRLLIAALLIMTAASAVVQAAGTNYNILVVCRFDIEQYCKGIERKRIRDLRECLAKNQQNLLPTCQDHYKDAH